jgi:hypothetical protein
LLSFKTSLAASITGIPLKKLIGKEARQKNFLPGSRHLALVITLLTNSSKDKELLLIFFPRPVLSLSGLVDLGVKGFGKQHSRISL